jgi:hypothetical protein
MYFPQIESKLKSHNHMKEQVKLELTALDWLTFRFFIENGKIKNMNSIIPSIFQLSSTLNMFVNVILTC